MESDIGAIATQLQKPNSAATLFAAWERAKEFRVFLRIGLGKNAPIRSCQPLSAALRHHQNISTQPFAIIRALKMPALDLIDHSPQQPEAVAPLATASNVILIDNFDSFSWNIYQYLVLEGATVTVYRNDAITVKDLAELQPTQLVISPGPGHPSTDSGVSRDAIQYFAGKIPVLGVCMGQ